MKCTLCTREMERTTRSGRCRSCQRVRAPSRSTTVHPSTPYALDVGAQRFVAEHPDGASLYEIAEAMGVSAERVRQIEEAALRGLRARAQLAGIEQSDLALLVGGGARSLMRQPLAEKQIEEPGHRKDEEGSDVARALSACIDNLERRLARIQALLAARSEVAA